VNNRRFVVHRQLSACSFYVRGDLVVQLGDFTRARAVVDDEFVAETQEPVWIKWAAPEVLRHLRYSTKSDVWALAVVFWQVATIVVDKLPDLQLHSSNVLFQHFQGLILLCGN